MPTNLNKEQIQVIRMLGGALPETIRQLGQGLGVVMDKSDEDPFIATVLISALGEFISRTIPRGMQPEVIATVGQQMDGFVEEFNAASDRAGR